MTKAEFVEGLSEDFQITKKLAAAVMDRAFERIAASTKEQGRFSYPGFGVWTMRTRRARRIRNPQTGEIMTLPATRTMGFRAAKAINPKT